MTSPFGSLARFTLRCRWLVPQTRSPLQAGWVRVERGLITGIGRRSPPGPAAEQIELEDAIILPGLVNAHTHLEFSDVAAPLDTAGGLPGWISRLVAHRRLVASSGLQSETISRAIDRGLAESAAAGVTRIGEIASHAPPTPHGPRGPAVRVFREALGLRPASMAAATTAVGSDLDRLARAGRPAGISPHAPYSVAAPLGRWLIAAACRRGLPVAMHLCESLDEEEFLASGSGAFRELLERLGAWDSANPSAFLSPAEWIGLLARARRGIVVHATHIGRDPRALARLARHADRLAVVVCPRTTQLLSATLPPVRLLSAAGIRVAIGTDSRASNPDLSVLAECRTLVDAGLVSPEESLRMATINGAWALAAEQRAGRIAVGRPADLVVLRPAAPAADPCAAAVEPGTRVAATLRRGRLLFGRLDPPGRSRSPGQPANRTQP